MYLKDALFQCSKIVAEVADLYAELSALAPTDPDKADLFREMARREGDRSRLLKALGELFLALGDDGPFLVQARSDLSSLRRHLYNAQRKLNEDAGGAPARCLESLDSAPRREVVVSLLECAEPELCRVLRVIDSESRAIRKTSSAKRSGSIRGVRAVAGVPEDLPAAPLSGR